MALLGVAMARVVRLMASCVPVLPLVLPTSVLIVVRGSMTGRTLPPK